MVVAEALKLTAMGLTLAFAALGAIFPISIDPKRGGSFACCRSLGPGALETAMGMCNCVAAGVVFSIALTHMLPDTQEALMKAGVGSAGVITNTLAGCSMLLMLFFEKACAPKQAIIVGGERQPAERPTPTTPHTEAAVGDACAGICTLDEQSCESACLVTGGHQSDHFHQVSYGSKPFRQGFESGVKMAGHLAPEPCCKEAERMGSVTVSEARWMPQLLLSVLCLHSVVEGITLGSAQSAAGATAIAVAILAHKALAGMALGVAWCRHGVPTRVHCVYAAIFAGMTPLGAALGIGVTASLRGRQLLLYAYITQAVGAGTFLHIGLKEFLYEEFDRTDSTPVLLKCLFLSLGYGAMTWIAFYV